MYTQKAQRDTLYKNLNFIQKRTYNSCKVHRRICADIGTGHYFWLSLNCYIMVLHFPVLHFPSTQVLRILDRQLALDSLY